MSDLIAGYVQTLRRELAFDPVLAARAAEEIEDHLREAALEHGRDEAAQRRALARLGDPSVMAADFAQAWLPQRLKLTWRAIALAAVAIFVAMRLRHLLMPLDGAGVPVFLQLAAWFDRYAFVAALVVGLGGWLGLRHRASEPLRRRTPLLQLVSAIALALSTMGGLVVIAQAIAATGWTDQVAAPAAAAAGEVMMLAIAFHQLRNLYMQSRSAGIGWLSVPRP